MKNTIECPKCHTLNPQYRYVCLNCKTYIRERVFNIDFWKIFWKTFESPIKSFNEIIHSEHKNYLLFILFLVSFKLSINSLVLTNLFRNEYNLTDDISVNLIFLTATYFGIFILYSLITKFVLQVFSIKSRFLDNLAVFTYSQVPLLFSLFFIFPVQLGVFGMHWIIGNPEPIMLKNTIAYMLYGLDGLFLIWGLINIIFAHFTQLQKKISSILFGIIFYLIIIGLFFFFPFIQS